MKLKYSLLMGILILLSIDLSAEKYVVIGNTLNVRNAPMTTGAIIGQLKKDLEINVEEIVNDFASFDFMGQKGYISTKYIQKVLPATETPIEMIDKNIENGSPNQRSEQETKTEDISAETDAETDNVVLSASKKMGKEFSKLKEKVNGLKKDKKEKTHRKGNDSDLDSLVSNFSKLKDKKVKYHVVNDDYVYGYTTELENFKDDNGHTQAFGFRVEEHRDGKTYFYIFQDYSSGSVPEGSKMLIRAADGTVGEIVAVNSGKSELYRYWNMDGLASNHHYTIDQSSFRIYYQVPLELIQAIQKYGIIKIRDIQSDTKVWDYTFSNKRFDKANEKSYNMLCTICGYYNNRGYNPYYSRWKETKPKKKEVPEF